MTIRLHIRSWYPCGQSSYGIWKRAGESSINKSSGYPKQELPTLQQSFTS